MRRPSVDPTANNFYRGEEFRKAYADLGTIREYFGTGALVNPVEVVSDLDQPNCYYNILLGGGS